MLETEEDRLRRYKAWLRQQYALRRGIELGKAQP